VQRWPRTTATCRCRLTAPCSPFLGSDEDEIRRITSALSEADLERATRREGPDHQIGGHSTAFQRPLEVTAATAAGVEGWYEDPDFLAAARDYVLLLQLDEDDTAGMLWGDGGLAMWAMHRSDLEAGDFGRVHVVIESH
jgi:hypothetical protein